MTATFRIPGDALHRLVYNSLLFDTKSAKAWQATTELSMNTCDGQVYLEDKAEIDGNTGERRWIMSAEMSKLMENDLRQIKSGTIGVAVGKGGLVLQQDMYEIGMYEASIGEYAQQSELFEYDHFDTLATARFSINPDRLRKLALIQPRDYPVDCELREVDGIPTDVLFFTKGPSVRGTYATLQRVET